MRNTLSGALDDAVTEKLISENWTKGVVLPKYVRPKPLVWTPWSVSGALARPRDGPAPAPIGTSGPWADLLAAASRQ